MKTRITTIRLPSGKRNLIQPLWTYPEGNAYATHGINPQLKFICINH